jgi:hypothetical protein
MSAEQSGTAIVIDVVFRQWADLTGVANDARRDWIVALSPECVEAGLWSLRADARARLSLRTAYQTTCGSRGFKLGPFWGLDMSKIPWCRLRGTAAAPLTIRS